MPRAAVAAKIVLSAHADGHYRFAVVSDTHSQAHPATEQRLLELAPDSILHGGDIGELEVLETLARVAPVYAVRGNIDVHARSIPDVLTLEVIAGNIMRLRILLTHIAVYGPKLRAEVARRASAERAGLVVCGHSHVPFIGRDRGIAMFNPGSIGPRRFALPIVLGCIDLTATGVRMRHIDCETGADWLPPESPRARA
ncbi:MAG: metallophosphoesterase family protein [Polyangiaceae bacterium]